jgi:hypothetical protein
MELSEVVAVGFYLLSWLRIWNLPWRPEVRGREVKRERASLGAEEQSMSLLAIAAHTGFFFFQLLGMHYTMYFRFRWSWIQHTIILYLLVSSLQPTYKLLRLELMSHLALSI